MSQPAPRIAVIVASKGRSDTLRDLIGFINAQTLRPVTVTLSLTEPADADFDLAAALAPGIAGECIYGAPGLPRQRNRGLMRVGEDIDYIVFWDDDFCPSRYALEGMALGFRHYPEVAGITGRLLADGINGPGIRLQEARAMLERHDARGAPDPKRPPKILHRRHGLYGCNMALRRSAAGGLRFDERLPAYGWLEDVDFGAQLPGLRVKLAEFAGVHLGTKGGRETAGARLGYSQIVNPYYLWRKGTVPFFFGFEIVLRNIAANLVRSLRPEPWIDRKGRLRGNLIGLREVAQGRAAPERIADWPYA